MKKVERGGTYNMNGENKYIRILAARKKRDHLRHVGIDGKIMIKWILKKNIYKLTGLNWLRLVFNSRCYAIVLSVKRAATSVCG
jgi:hypothetical protein